MASQSFPDVVVKWNGKEYVITGLNFDKSIKDLKEAIKDETGVLPERQKLLGLKYKGKPPSEDTLLGDLNLKPKTKIMMMGTREEILADVLEPPADMPEVMNDFDIEEEEILMENREEYLTKIQRRVKDYTIDLISDPRPGKKLLVLDIDYTLFDHRSVAETGTELMRPYLHEFLASAYEDYDIAIWSATSLKWIKAKMEELGVMTNINYKLCFMIDSLAMITVDTGPKYGVIEIKNSDNWLPLYVSYTEVKLLSSNSLARCKDLLEQVKPLGVIWGKFEQYNSRNTIMFDDLRRNFLMNPQNGLKIRPFCKAHMNRHKDQELLKLADYLKEIGQLEDLSSLNHKKWESYMSKRHKEPGHGSKRQKTEGES